MIFFCNLNYPHSDFFCILLCSFIAVLLFDAKTQKLHSLETTNLIFGKIRALNILFEVGQEESFLATSTSAFYKSCSGFYYVRQRLLFITFSFVLFCCNFHRCLCMCDTLKPIRHLLLKYFLLFLVFPTVTLYNIWECIYYSCSTFWPQVHSFFACWRTNYDAKSRKHAKNSSNLLQYYSSYEGIG